MISWKHSFKRLNEEYEMARKKKQALDNLLNSGRISQPTHGLFNKEIDEAIGEIEKQQKALLEKMHSKIIELEGQIKTLEVLLANFEVQHVTGEVDEEVYQRETTLISMGLETTRHELDAIREAMNKLSITTQIPTTSTVVQHEIEPPPSGNVEVSKTEIQIAEEPVSAVEKMPESSCQTPQGQPEETLQSTEEPPSTETKTGSEEKQEA